MLGFSGPLKESTAPVPRDKYVTSRKMGVLLHCGILFWNPSFGGPVSRSRFMACHGIPGPARYMNFTQAGVL
jgi:hypothetical protein